MLVGWQVGTSNHNYMLSPALTSIPGSALTVFFDAFVRAGHGTDYHPLIGSVFH